jgi:uncharacterized membrane protein
MYLGYFRPKLAKEIELLTSFSTYTRLKYENRLSKITNKETERHIYHIATIFTYHYLHIEKVGGKMMKRCDLCHCDTPHYEHIGNYTYRNTAYQLQKNHNTVSLCEKCYNKMMSYKKQFIIFIYFDKLLLRDISKEIVLLYRMLLGFL